MTDPIDRNHWIPQPTHVPRFDRTQPIEVRIVEDLGYLPFTDRRYQAYQAEFGDTWAVGSAPHLVVIYQDGIAYWQRPYPNRTTARARAAQAFNTYLAGATLHHQSLPLKRTRTAKPKG